MYGCYFQSFRGTLLDAIQSIPMSIYNIMFIFLIMGISGNPKKNTNRETT
jgi:hypothetical protein